MHIKFEHIAKPIKQLLIWMLRKDAFIFLLFVGLATLFWWGRAMSSQRDIEVKLPVVYANVPAQVVFETPLPSHLVVVLRENGRLLRQVQHTKPTVTISLSDKLSSDGGTLQLSTDVIRQKIQDVLPGSTNIQQIRPEEITSDYYVEATKRVPIKLCAEWTMEQQYQLSAPPVLEPAFVDIYGTQESVEQVDSISTNNVIVDKVYDTVQREVTLQMPAGIRSQTTATTVSWISETFTDKSFVLPIEVEGVPEEEEMRLFPKTTTVTARVGISHFAEVTEDNFRAVCEYPNQSQATLSVTVVCNTPYVTKMRTSIREVEYIIERKQ